MLTTCVADVVAQAGTTWSFRWLVDSSAPASSADGSAYGTDAEVPSGNSTTVFSVVSPQLDFISQTAWLSVEHVFARSGSHRLTIAVRGVGSQSVALAVTDVRIAIMEPSVSSTGTASRTSTSTGTSSATGTSTVTGSANTTASGTVTSSESATATATASSTATATQTSLVIGHDNEHCNGQQHINQHRHHDPNKLSHIDRFRHSIPNDSLGLRRVRPIRSANQLVGGCSW